MTSRDHCHSSRICLIQPCTSAMYISFVHQPCASAVYISLVHPPCTSAVCISLVHQPCTSAVYISCSLDLQVQITEGP